LERTELELTITIFFHFIFKQNNCCIVLFCEHAEPEHRTDIDGTIPGLRGRPIGDVNSTDNMRDWTGMTIVNCIRLQKTEWCGLWRAVTPSSVTSDLNSAMRIEEEVYRRCRRRTTPRRLSDVLGQL